MKLSTDRIIDAGMSIFAEFGYHGLSMRRVADRLDARAGSLYYHVRDKGELLRLMADRVAQQAYDAGTVALAALPPAADWRERVMAQAVTLRQSIRRHQGGSQLFADSPKLISSGALSLMERLLETLASAGVPEADRSIAADTLLSHITGFVLQEQSAVVPEISQEHAAELHSRFPLTVAGAAQYSDDEQFTRSLTLLCAAIATLVES